MKPQSLKEADLLCKKLAEVQTRIFQIGGNNFVSQVEISVGGGSEQLCVAPRGMGDQVGRTGDYLLGDDDAELRDWITTKLKTTERLIKARLEEIGCELPAPWPQLAKVS